MAARGVSGMADALEAVKASATRKNDVLIKAQPSAIWFLFGEYEK